MTPPKPDTQALRERLQAEFRSLDALVSTCESRLHESPIGCHICLRDERQMDILRDVDAAFLDAETREQKGQRVFEAVVYAFEGREIPDDLREHGMVRRAMKHRAKAEAKVTALREALVEAQAEVWRHGSGNERLLPLFKRIAAALSAPPAATGPTETPDPPLFVHVGWLLAKVRDDERYPEARGIWERYSAWQDSALPPAPQAAQGAAPNEYPEPVHCHWCGTPILDEVLCGDCHDDDVPAPPAPGPAQETRTEPLIDPASLRALIEQWRAHAEKQRAFTSSEECFNPIAMAGMADANEARADDLDRLVSAGTDRTGAERALIAEWKERSTPSQSDADDATLRCARELERLL